MIPWLSGILQVAHKAEAGHTCIDVKFTKAWARGECVRIDDRMGREGMNTNGKQQQKIKEDDRSTSGSMREASVISYMNTHKRVWYHIIWKVLKSTTVR